MGIYLLLIPVLIAAAAVLLYNSLVRLRNSSEEAFSTMDVYMKKRYDLVPNLVNSVKGYASHEKETLQRVVEARNSAMGTASLDQRQQSENMLSGALKSLFALSEAYPDLKADRQFLDLQTQLQKIEQDIAQSRKYYNAVVRELNTKVEAFPSNIIASLFKFKKAQFFTMDESDRAPVEVRFSS